MTRPQVALSIVAAALFVLLFDREARSDERSIIKMAADHPHYVFEAEPHLILGWGDPFFPSGLPGGGFRGTFHITNGFVKTINDSVGVGFGFDVATNGHLIVPIVMQWNFWLSTHWSVFGEPGIVIGAGGARTQVEPAFFAGGRFLFTDRVTLALRLGYPALSVGVSFLL